jgi:hypothetical protein
MVAPEPREPLVLYIATTVEAVSTVLVVERPEPCQHQEPEAHKISVVSSYPLRVMLQNP